MIVAVVLLPAEMLAGLGALAESEKFTVVAAAQANASLPTSTDPRPVTRL